MYFWNGTDMSLSAKDGATTTIRAIGSCVERIKIYNNKMKGCITSEPWKKILYENSFGFIQR